MDQFLVPQFIDVEPKVIGPITVRQFLIIIVAFLIVVIEYKLLDFGTFVFGAALTGGILGTVAFVRVNGRPFHFFLLNMLETLTRPRLYLWNKQLSSSETRQILQAELASPAPVTPAPPRRPLDRSHLEELALVVNTGGAYRSE